MDELRRETEQNLGAKEMSSDKPDKSSRLWYFKVFEEKTFVYRDRAKLKSSGRGGREFGELERVEACEQDSKEAVQVSIVSEPLQGIESLFCLLFFLA